MAPGMRSLALILDTGFACRCMGSGVDSSRQGAVISGASSGSGGGECCDANGCTPGEWLPTPRVHVGEWLPTPRNRNPALEELLQELFRLQDLNSNGLLEEEELITLNTGWRGASVDTAAVRDKCKALFRTGFDRDGRPVPYPAFRLHILRALDCLDEDETAQEAAVEQLVAVARAARAEVKGIEATCSGSGRCDRIRSPLRRAIQPVEYVAAGGA